MEQKIKDIAFIINEKIISTSLSNENYISTENILPYYKGVLPASSIPNGKVTGFKPGDTLLSNIRPYFRKLWFANFTGGCSNDVFVIRAVSKKILNKYLYYALCNDRFINYYVASCKGTKMPRGNKDALLDWEIDIPGMQIQQHIVNNTTREFYD